MEALAGGGGGGMAKAAATAVKGAVGVTEAGVAAMAAGEVDAGAA